MQIKIDLWDVGGIVGGSLVLVGLGLIAWPLILVGVGGGIVGFSLWGAKKWGSSQSS